MPGLIDSEKHRKYSSRQWPGDSLCSAVPQRRRPLLKCFRRQRPSLRPATQYWHYFHLTPPAMGYDASRKFPARLVPLSTSPKWSPRRRQPLIRGPFDHLRTKLVIVSDGHSPTRKTPLYFLQFASRGWPVSK